LQMAYVRIGGQAQPRQPPGEQPAEAPTPPPGGAPGAGGPGAQRPDAPAEGQGPVAALAARLPRRSKCGLRLTCGRRPFCGCWLR
jgi:hypothetical protein